MGCHCASKWHGKNTLPEKVHMVLVAFTIIHQQGLSNERLIVLFGGCRLGSARTMTCLWAPCIAGLSSHETWLNVTYVNRPYLSTPRDLKHSFSTSGTTPLPPQLTAGRQLTWLSNILTIMPQFRWFATALSGDLSQLSEQISHSGARSPPVTADNRDDIMPVIIIAFIADFWTHPGQI